MSLGNASLAFWILWICVSLPNGSQGGPMSLTILHTNDVHARYEEENAFGGPCPESEAQNRKCYGGMARLMTKVTELRKKDQNTLLLDGGDYYQGSLLFTEYTYNITSDFTNRLKYDAIALGNHEFDNGVAGLVPYLEAVKFPVLACNLDLSQEPTMQGKVKCSHIFQVAGEKIAVLGFITPETKQLATTGKVIFLDEVPSLQAEVDRLKTEGINKFIAVGHSGFDVDKDIAKRVKGLDVVIGGHSNTFLYTGTPPKEDESKVKGPYPTIVKQDDGNEVLVVQDYAYAKYLGLLRVHFNGEGKIVHYSGNPILLDSSVEMDREISSALEPYKKGIEEMSRQVMGTTYVLLRGDREHCRQQECNLGNFFTDACVQYHLKGPDDGYWNKYPIAIWNSGAIRASIDEQTRQGNVTMGDILFVAPFRNPMAIISLYGRDLMLTMEHGVSKYDVTAQNSPGAFLQVSGIKVTYDLNQPPGKRVVDLMALCSKCRVPRYKKVLANQVYFVIVPRYILDGGDGFNILRERMISIFETGNLDMDVLVRHFQRMSPVTTGEEGRIKFVSIKDHGGTNGGHTGFGSFRIVYFLLVILLFWKIL